MPDYTIEVIDVDDDSVMYSFDSEGVQAVQVSRPWSANETDDGRYTKVPVYQPPDNEQFLTEMSNRIGNITYRVLESGGSLLVEGGAVEAIRLTGIARGPLEVDFPYGPFEEGQVIEDPDGAGRVEGVFFLLFDDVASGLVSEEHRHPANPPYEPPSYPTPWGREVEYLGYCW